MFNPLILIKMSDLNILIQVEKYNIYEKYNIQSIQYEKRN